MWCFDIHVHWNDYYNQANWHVIVSFVSFFLNFSFWVWLEHLRSTSLFEMASIKLCHIMWSEKTRDWKTNPAWFYLYVQTKKAKPLKVEENKIVVARIWGVEILVKVYKICFAGWIRFGGLLYSHVTIINSTVVCIFDISHFQ